MSFNNYKYEIYGISICLLFVPIIFLFTLILDINEIDMLKHINFGVFLGFLSILFRNIFISEYIKSNVSTYLFISKIHVFTFICFLYTFEVYDNYKIVDQKFDLLWNLIGYILIILISCPNNNLKNGDNK